MVIVAYILLTVGILHVIAAIGSAARGTILLWRCRDWPDPQLKRRRSAAGAHWLVAAVFACALAQLWLYAARIVAEAFA